MPSPTNSGPKLAKVLSNEERGPQGTDEEQLVWVYCQGEQEKKDVFSCCQQSQRPRRRAREQAKGTTWELLLRSSLPTVPAPYTSAEREAFWADVGALLDASAAAAGGQSRWPNLLVTDSENLCQVAALGHIRSKLAQAARLREGDLMTVVLAADFGHLCGVLISGTPLQKCWALSAGPVQAEREISLASRDVKLRCGVFVQRHKLVRIGDSQESDKPVEEPLFGARCMALFSDGRFAYCAVSPDGSRSVEAAGKWEVINGQVVLRDGQNVTGGHLRLSKLAARPVPDVRYEELIYVSLEELEADFEAITLAECIPRGGHLLRLQLLEEGIATLGAAPSAAPGPVPTEATVLTSALDSTFNAAWDTTSPAPLEAEAQKPAESPMPPEPRTYFLRTPIHALLSLANPAAEHAEVSDERAAPRLLGMQRGITTSLPASGDMWDEPFRISPLQLGEPTGLLPGAFRLPSGYKLPPDDGVTMTFPTCSIEPGLYRFELGQPKDYSYKKLEMRLHVDGKCDYKEEMQGSSLRATPNSAVWRVESNLLVLDSAKTSPGFMLRESRGNKSMERKVSRIDIPISFVLGSCSCTPWSQRLRPFPQHLPQPESHLVFGVVDPDSPALRGLRCRPDRLPYHAFERELRLQGLPVDEILTDFRFVDRDSDGLVSVEDMRRLETYGSPVAAPEVLEDLREALVKNFGNLTSAFEALSARAGAGRVTAEEFDAFIGTFEATLATEALSGRQPQFWLKSKAPAPKCNDKKLVNSESDKFLACPKECPVYADDRGDGVDCNFECVEATPKACTAVNKFEPIPDKEMGICRACIIYGCAECKTDGTDTCARCDSGYSVNAKGTCDNDNRYYWYALFVVLGGVTLFIVAWIVDICTRPIVNADGLKGALDYRSRSKVRMPKSSNDDEGRELYPLDTNLLKESVAGVGVTLHFNFQLFLIVWSLGIAVGWLLLSLSVDDALLILGTRRAKTARQNCILVAWGFETQQRLMWTKIDFVVVVYLLTVLGCVLFGIRQLRLFQKVDMQNSTHKDYAARIRNLPLLDGTTPVEDELKERIQEATGQKVVGVSVCWDFQEHEEELLDLLQSQLVEKELELLPMPQREEEPEEPQGFFARMERAALAADAQKVVATGEMTEEEKQKALEEAAQAQPGEEIIEECKEVDVIGILKSIKTCPDAYAIFETETARDAAVEATVASGGVEFHGNTLKMNASRVEPQTVKWQNCANTDLVVKAKRVALGMCIMLAGLGVWVVAFYLPYAWFSLTFNYSYGQEPGFVAGMTFSMVVVAGNALMYLVCSEVADRTRFIYIDDREVCYMLLYCFACVFNVALDLITTYMVAYRINVGLHMKTYDGTLLQNLQSFSDRFESYAMQRTLANNLYAYAFPATFLIPFLIEPVATIYAPYKLMMMIVRTQPNMKGFMAENLLGSLVFDLSRYADLLLDAMIAVLIFFFPGGFNIQMFLGMALSHVYIYFFDHYRVLRSIQSCSYTDRMVDWWSQWLMCIPCGCMMACFVFKANCQPGYFCLEGDEMVAACAAAFFAHIALHTLLLRYVVPKFGLVGESDGADTNTYVACSKRLPCSWFTSNPVFCLRSQYVYKHSPPCTYYLPGKEHLIEQNVEIGLYFKDCPAKEEDYDAPHVDTEALKAQMKEMHGKVSGHMEEFKGKMTSQMEEMKGKVSGNLEQLKGKVSGHFDKLLKKDGPDGPDGDAQGSGGSASQS
ncbi:unnamed protein product [Effrenium voratum]|nr:unnamed protein product [Effrenium voratum]